MFKILIDADACPVKDEVYKVAIRNNLNVVVVSNGGIRPYKHPLIKNVYVGQGFNEADGYILDLLSEKDIVVTNDILLAHECIKKFASVLKYSGEILDKTNIANEVSKRNLMTEIRSSDPFHLSKSKPFLKKYKSNFLNNLEILIRGHHKNE